MPQLVEEGSVIRLTAVRSQHEVDLVGHAHRRTEGARALPFSLHGVEDHPAARVRIHAHLFRLTAYLPLHLGAREIWIELRRAHERQRVRARGVARIDSELLPHARAEDVLPHLACVAQESLTLVDQISEIYPAQRAEGSVVIRCYVEPLGEVALALEALQPERRELRGHELRTRRFEHETLRAVGGVRDLDGNPLEGDPAAIGHVHYR